MHKVQATTVSRIQENNIESQNICPAASNRGDSEKVLVASVE